MESVSNSPLQKSKPHAVYQVWRKKPPRLALVNCDAKVPFANGAHFHMMLSSWFTDDAGNLIETHEHKGEFDEW